MSAKIANLVELKVPVSADYVSVVRLLVSGLGNRLGLPIDELENLKLMIGEAFLTVVTKAEGAAGLMHLTWKQDGARITVSLSDPSGKHKSIASTNSASLALLQSMGGELSSKVVDGVPQLDLGFTIRYKEDRPHIFNDKENGRA
ncbi:hypothetical protein IT575_07205 [bacterium]|nr:hypothetical protein [bacterium]